MAQLDPIYLPRARQTGAVCTSEVETATSLTQTSSLSIFLFLHFSPRLVAEKLLTTVITASSATNQTEVCLWCNANRID